MQSIRFISLLFCIIFWVAIFILFFFMSSLLLFLFNLFGSVVLCLVSVMTSWWLHNTAQKKCKNTDTLGLIILISWPLQTCLGIRALILCYGALQLPCLCLISFPYCAGAWTDVYGIQRSVHFFLSPLACPHISCQYYVSLLAELQTEKILHRRRNWMDIRKVSENM